MRRFLEVVGQGAATQAPDRLDLYVSVTLVEPDVGTALARLGERTTALGAALRAEGLTDTDLRTTGSNVSEEYAGSDPSGRPVPAGFRASADLRVRLSDPDAASRIVDAAVAAVGDDFRLGHLAWSIADETALTDLARAAAFADAGEKAAKLAALAGAELGKLLRVSEGAGFGGGLPRLMAAKTDSSFGAERGENSMEISLSTRWALAPVD